MNPTVITLCFLAFAIIMFVLEKIPLGLTATIVSVGLCVTGVLEPKQAFAGYVDSNVILCVAMFVVGQALFETGMANKIGGLVTKFAKSERQLIIAIMVITGLIRRILPALGNYKLTDLRKEVIREFYEEMRHTPRLDGRGNLSEKSVEGLHNTLCGILSAAVDEGYLTHNPAWRCYKPKGQKKERPVADEETVKKLITAFEGQSMKYETYFKLVLATGLRRGEACGLKWSDINWRKRTIHVQRGVVKLSHQESITKDPKTSSGDRMVYLSKEMCQLLKAWRKECEWDRAQTANETVDEDDYLFRQPNGKPMNPCTFTYRFKLILKANNLPLDLNVHSLRHTNASLLIAQGVDVRTVASLLGHAQASTTLDIYAHAFDKNKRKAQEKLGKAIGL